MLNKRLVNFSEKEKLEGQEFLIRWLKECIIDLVENNQIRICSECNSLMIEGYCIEQGLAYYCCDDCLHKNMTEEEFLCLYDNGKGESYFTDFEGDRRVEYALNELLRAFPIVGINNNSGGKEG